MTCCLLACVPPPNNSCWSSAACCARSSTCVSVCVSHFLQDRDERRLKICLHTMAGHSLTAPPYTTHRRLFLSRLLTATTAATTLCVRRRRPLHGARTLMSGWSIRRGPGGASALHGCVAQAQDGPKTSRGEGRPGEGEGGEGR